MKKKALSIGINLDMRPSPSFGLRSVTLITTVNVKKVDILWHHRRASETHIGPTWPMGIGACGDCPPALLLLAGASRTSNLTISRKLKEVHYLTSYSHGGRF
jgi:hypothetical protein